MPLFPILTLAALGVTASPVRYDGHALVRIEVEDATDVIIAREAGADIWDEHPTPGSITARVGPGDLPALAITDLEFEVVVPDLQTVIDNERIRIDTAPPLDHDTNFFDDFRRYEELDAHLDAIAAHDSELATVVDVGTSLEGRQIRGLRIDAAPEGAPVILINGGQHAREWIATMSTECVADRIVTESQDTAIATMLSEVAFLIVPLVNPDGYVHSWDVDRLWRKNRREDHGVDTNRNFGVAFGGPGSSSNQDENDFHGEEAYSEPEVAALREFAMANEDIHSYLDVHTFGQLVLFPWGHTQEQAPAHDTLRQLAVDVAGAMGLPHGTEYTELRAVHLYPASGTALDWGYGEMGYYSLTLELRPSHEEEFEEFGEGFMIGPENINATCDELLAGVLELGFFTSSTPPGAPGDDGNATSAGTETGGMDESGESEGGEMTTGGETGGATTSPSTTAPMPTTAPADDGGETGGESGSDDGGEAQSEGDGSGCGCRPSAPSGWGLFAFCLAALRRRR